MARIKAMSKIKNRISDIKIAEGLYKEISVLIEQSRKQVALILLY